MECVLASANVAFCGEGGLCAEGGREVNIAVFERGGKGRGHAPDQLQEGRFFFAEPGVSFNERRQRNIQASFYNQL